MDLGRLRERVLFMEGDARFVGEDGDLVCRFLALPEAYSEGTACVEVRETHISLVFLSDRFAYKLKKRVQFDFLDFSTVELREQACLAELQLNRRLAPDVYLDVVPVTRTAEGRLQIGGSGEAIDWLVKMRRLDDADTLLTMIRQGSVSSSKISEIATLLADFYRR